VLARLMSLLDDLDTRPAPWPTRHTDGVAITGRAVASQMGLDTEACRLAHAAGLVMTLACSCVRIGSCRASAP
jgi:hypothetical protein